MSPRLPIRLLAAQSDRRLVELVQTGHERAFEVLVHRYRRQLLRYCGRLGLTDSRAEDALQQSLLRAWLSLQRGVEVRELKPWLYRIVHNTAVNLMRSSREEHAPLTDVAQLTLVGAADSVFERRLAVREALADVAALPPLQRDAILMSAVDGHSHEEVASALGITHGAVRGLLYRARATLRSAAAALTPQPLLAWAAGSASRVAPAASRLAELSAAGGSESGGTLLKGVAVALTSAAAAGAVLVPLPHHRAHLAAPDARVASVGTRVSAPSRSGDAAGPLAATRLVSATHASGRNVLTPSARAGTPRRLPMAGDRTLSHTHALTLHGGHDRAGRRGNDSGASGDGADGGLLMRRSSGEDGGAFGSLAQRAGDGGGGSGSGSSSGTSGGDGSQSVSAGAGSSSGSGDSGSSSSDGGSAEREAEAVREREARAAREQSEREAEAAALATKDS
jgi:RNA polymerase sigma factor (sigma-70 family)